MSCIIEIFYQYLQCETIRIPNSTKQNKTTDMKTNQRTLSWAILLILIFTLIIGTFCYFLGKTDTLGAAFSGFMHFGYALFPVFFLVIGLAVYDLRRIGKKKKE